MNHKRDKLDILLIAFKSCDEEKKKRILHLKIVEEAMLLVKKIAHNISVQSGVNCEDLIQVGAMGLIKSIDSYNSNHNTKFKTYATYFIKGEIKHYLRDKVGIIKAPRELHELVFKINGVVKKMYENGIEEPSADDIANILQIPNEKVIEVLNLDKYRYALSLDQYFNNNDDDFSLVERIPSGDYEEFINAYEDKIMIAGAINKLSFEYREIIRLCYYEDLSQREIAQRLNLSQMQVSRKLKKALSKMYNLIKNKES